jgi:hypothetical protein
LALVLTSHSSIFFASLKVVYWYADKVIDSSFFLLKRKKNRTNSQR